jgi:hypothetical protein
VKKPSAVGEAVFKLLWESAWWADFHQRRQFPQTSDSSSCRSLAFDTFPPFAMKISRQDGLGTTLRLSVDPHHPPF